MTIIMDMHSFSDSFHELRKRTILLVERCGGNVWKNGWLDGWITMVNKGAGS